MRDEAIAMLHPARLVARAGAHWTPSLRYAQVDDGVGVHLLALAAHHPEGHYVGVTGDGALRDRMTAVAAACGLRNVQWSSELEGGFDVVVHLGSHGRDLPALRDALATDGLLALGYPTRPGGAVREMVQDLVGTGEDLAGRALVGKLARVLGGQSSEHPFRRLLEGELRRTLDGDTAEVTGARYVDEVIAEAEALGLHYRGEMVPASLDGGLEVEVLGQLQAEGVSAPLAERCLDLAAYRSWRVSLFSAVAERAATDGHLCSRILPEGDGALGGDGSMAFRTETGVIIEVAPPLLQAALLVLGESWPAGLPRDQLIEAAAQRLREHALLDDETVGPAARKASGEDLDALVARRQIESWPFALVVDRTLRERPALASFTRWEAEHRGVVTTVRHQPVELDPVCRAVFPLLDGERDFEALIIALSQRIDAGLVALELDDQPTPEQRANLIAQLVMQAVAQAQRLGLLA